MPDDDFASLVDRVLLVGENDSQRIAEDRAGFIEGNAVLGQIRDGRAAVPLEASFEKSMSGAK